MIAADGPGVPPLVVTVACWQSAAVDSVSGATYTSASYAASLQSALDKAGFKAPDGSTAPTTAPSAPADGHGRGGHGGGFFG